jgi:hypothetical protein
MGQRTKNRILEHSGPGHRLIKSNITHAGTVVAVKKADYHNKSFWLCICGWEGWLTNKLNDME